MPKKCVKTEYTRKLTDCQKSQAISIYNIDEVSYCLPDIKYAGICFMSCTVEEAYQRHYIPKFSNQKLMSLKSFYNLKPNNIRTIQETPLHGCKCDICQNFGIVRTCLVGLGFKGIPKNHSCSIEVTWCPFHDIPYDSDKQICDKLTHSDIPNNEQ